MSTSETDRRQDRGQLDTSVTWQREGDQERSHLDTSVT